MNRILGAALAAFLPVFLASHAAAASCPGVEFVRVEPRASADTRPVRFRGNRAIQVARVPIATAADLAKVEVVGGDINPAILITLKPEAAARLERTTSEPNFPLAVVLGDEALLSVVIEGGYGIGKDGVQVALGELERTGAVAAAIQGCL